MTQAPIAPPSPATEPVSNANPLTGAQLLERYQTLKAAGLIHSDIAVECGYYIRVEEGAKAGEIRAASSKLNVALLRAQGIDVPESTTRRSGGGAGYTKVKVGTNGKATLSQAMVKQMNANAGDVLELVEANEQGIALRLLRQPG